MKTKLTLRLEDELKVLSRALKLLKKTITNISRRNTFENLV
jgi:hypothetical protein